MSIKDIINPAGGIYYHIKAMRYRKPLWQAFVSSLGEYLEKWQPQSRELIIFGGSGGYCLEPNFIDRFDSLTLIDPDPLASHIFKKRFGKPVNAVHTNYLKEGLNSFEQLTHDYPEGAFLFSNILGQFPYLTDYSDDIALELKQSLAKMLKNVEWASYHDLFSFHFNKAHPDICWPLLTQARDKFETIDRLQQQTQLRPLKVQAVDHYTESLFPKELPKEKFYWQRTPYSYHIIEAVSQS